VHEPTQMELYEETHISKVDGYGEIDEKIRR
jgi:hypothetical protein